MSLARLTFACAAALVAGCASYEAPANLDQIEQPLARFDLDDAELRLSVVPLAEKGTAEKFLGIDPAEMELVPLMLELENRSAQPLKLVPASLQLRMEGGAALPALDIDDAFVRARTAGSGGAFASGVGAALLLGPVGTIAAASHSENVDRAASADYAAKRFHPWLLAPGAKAAGVVFFAGAPGPLAALDFTVRGLANGSERDLTLVLEKVAP